MKSGTVALVGRPNVGKSTLVNNLIGQKVAITSPKPQTTRFSINALYQDQRGQIIFIDTPGIFNKAKDALARTINKRSKAALQEEIDVVLYIVDPTRRRDFEESKVLGLVRQIKKPVILVFNKSDLPATYIPQYVFLEEEFSDHIIISALRKKNLKDLLSRIFSYLPEAKKESLHPPSPYPGLNIDSKTFIAEIIREKIFLKMRKELPYTTTVVVDEIAQRKNDVLYIQARILTTHDTYKKMLIGAKGRRVKEIGAMARKELEAAANKKMYLDLQVETDKHWISTLA